VHTPLDKKSNFLLVLYDLGCAFAVKGKVVDFSIQNAYVSAIRKAKRFLYVENQYFLGSSHAWLEYQGAGKCTHLVPIEIALKIADKIRSEQSFCCYVVLPMWPEGDIIHSFISMK
jgi:phospholipase D1/2